MEYSEIIDKINAGYIVQSKYNASKNPNYFSPKGSTSLLMLTVCFVGDLPIELQKEDFFIYGEFDTHHFKIKNCSDLKDLLMEMDALGGKTDDNLKQLFYDKNISIDNEVFLKVNFFGGI
ncbi:hypothetical protein [Flavobacterium sp.]|uniref:hypothetical protein n=1 Tax=Flavobacterium sp. TaxID=239 RepID=UPI003751291C